jgi:hypothetical protein
MLQSQSICISLATEADKNDIMYHLIHHFVKLNPLLNYLHISSQAFSLYVEPFVQASINQALALIAKDNHGCIMGICIAYDWTTAMQGDPKSITPSIQMYMEFFRQLNTYLKRYFAQEKIHIEHGKIICGGYLVVVPAFFGAAIPQLLGKELYSMAKNRGFQFIEAEFIDSCNYYLFKREFGHELKMIHKLAYKDFITKRGEQPLKDAYGECILTLRHII